VLNRQDAKVAKRAPEGLNRQDAKAAWGFAGAVVGAPRPEAGHVPLAASDLVATLSGLACRPRVRRVSRHGRGRPSNPDPGQAGGGADPGSRRVPRCPFRSGPVLGLGPKWRGWCFGQAARRADLPFRTTVTQDPCRPQHIACLRPWRAYHHGPESPPCLGVLAVQSFLGALLATLASWRFGSPCGSSFRRDGEVYLAITSRCRSNHQAHGTKSQATKPTTSIAFTLGGGGPKAVET
jgi:hypothetical protein